MARAEFLEIPHWADFQHYGKRSAPWIKLYGALLSNDDWLELSLPARGLLTSLWLIANERNGKVKWAPEALAMRLEVDVGELVECVKELTDNGFLTIPNSLNSLDSSASARREEKRREEKRSTNTPHQHDDLSTTRAREVGEGVEDVFDRMREKFGDEVFDYAIDKIKFSGRSIMDPRAYVLRVCQERRRELNGESERRDARRGNAAQRARDAAERAVRRLRDGDPRVESVHEQIVGCDGRTIRPALDPDEG